MGKVSTSVLARTGLINFFFYLFLFSYPVLSLLWRRSFPLLSTEVFVLLAIVVGMSIIFSLIANKLRPPIDYLLTGILILFVFMIQFNLLLEGMLVCIGFTTLLLFLLKQNFRVHSLPILVALLIGAYLDSRHEPLADQSEANAELVNTELPPVLHIVLDGFIGIGGLPPYSSSGLIRDEILSFFQTNDFQLFSHAYSRYASTVDSLNSSLNYRHDGEGTYVLELEDRSASVVKENAVFTSMETLGYRLNVYQTGHLDMCQSNLGNLDRCWQYDHPNVNSVVHSEKVGFRLYALVMVLLDQSKLLSEILTGQQGLAVLGITTHDPRVFDILEKDVRHKGVGNYFYAHVLLPHGPYAYQADCSVSYEAPYSLRLAYQRGEPVQPPLVYEIRNGMYFSQIECALRSLQSLIASLKENVDYERSIIILHGDHGSIITKNRPSFRNVEKMNKEDYRASFSTLFAVKYPGSKFSVDERALSLSYLLEEFMVLLPSLLNPAESYTVFRPSDTASPDKMGSYVYLNGTYPKNRIDIDIFKD